MRRTVASILVLVSLMLGPVAVWGQTALPLGNADLEGPARHTEGEGTSVSSWLAVDWRPWSILGDSVNNREVEYKLITLETSDSPDLRSHVHGGKHAQQFFTNGGSHTAGFYQRVKVPSNGVITFSIWVQMQSGDSLIFVDDRYVSDLTKGGGNYSVQVGIDPTGAEPAFFGAPLPASISWSELLWDIAAWGKDAKGFPADLWVPIQVSAQAQGEWVTVYTRGQCKYPTKYNSSFWDDASLTVTQPPTPTRPPPTPTSPATATPTATPAPTETPALTATPTVPTATHASVPTQAPSNTPLPSPTLTSTPIGTATPTPIVEVVPPTRTATWVPRPTATPTPAPASLISAQSVGLGIVIAFIAAAMVGGLWIGQRLARPR